MKNVTKKELVNRISEKTGFSYIDVKLTVESFIETIKESLSSGKNVEIRGFGRFKLRQRMPRRARNPRTGETVQVERGFKTRFEASEVLLRRLNPRDSKLEKESRREADTTGGGSES